MTTLKLSVEKICEEDLITMNIIIGTLFGYSEEAIRFFTIGGRMPSFIRYGSSAIASYEEFLKSDFSGTGYISYPQEVRDIIDGKLTKEEVIKGINERRLITTNFPDEGNDERYLVLDLTKLKLSEVSGYIKYAAS